MTSRKTMWVDDSNAALLTDLYELTMLQSYFDEGFNGTAVFDLFFRRLPSNRNYLIACGLEHVLHYLETFSFSPGAIDYLSSLDRFSTAFLESLREFRFTGDVYAMPEGTAVFAEEPVMEIVAPLPQAQIVETFLMNQVQLATLAASKAARVVTASRGKPVVDFGARRTQGADAALKAPRAFYIAGVDATSNVLAAQVYGIPVAGTMAHSYIQAFETEREAFRQFVRAFPSAILLIDTYETEKGVEEVIELARLMGSDFRVSGVRLDSGDLLKESIGVRHKLDQAGLTDLKIFASGSLDEYAIDRLMVDGAPIDGFGVGAHMATSSDAPVLDGVYKLVEYAGRPKMKTAASKTTLPGRKQVFRQKSQGKAVRDVIGLAGEKNPGEPLLLKVMENGRRTVDPESLDASRSRCRQGLQSLPDRLMSLSSAEETYVVERSSRLQKLFEETLKTVRG